MANYIDTLIKLGEKVSEAFDIRAVPTIIGIGQDVLNLVNEAAKTAKEKDLGRLNALRDDLEPKVIAHSTTTENKLRG